MRKTSLSVAALCLALAATTTLQGCYGSFNLTKKVYQFNGTIGNKWLKSLLFFVIATPVYGTTLFIDGVVLNLIEFWTGSNPVAAAQDHMDKSYADGTRVQAERLADGRLSVHLTTVAGTERSFVLTRSAEGISASTTKGTWIASVTESDRGTLLLTPKASQTALAQ